MDSYIGDSYIVGSYIVNSYIGEQVISYLAFWNKFSANTGV